MGAKRSRGLHLNSLPIIISAVTLGISLAAVLVITQIVYRHADSTINLSIQRNNAQIVENVAASIGSYIDEMVSVSNTVTDLLARNSAEKLSGGPVVFLREDIETIAVFDMDGAVLFSTAGCPLRKDIAVTEQPWFTRLGDNAGYVVSEPHVQRLFHGQYPWVITLTRNAYWMQEGELRRGIVLVDMNFTRIKDLCSRDLENNGYLSITSTEEKIIFHPRQQMIYAGILPDEIALTTGLPEGDSVAQNQESQLAVSVRTLSVPWRVIGVTPLKGLKTYDTGPSGYLRTAVCILALVLLVSSLAVSRFLARPLYRLMTLMGAMTDGGEADIAPVSGIYEVGRLSDSFNQMVARIQKLMRQVRMEQEQLRHSEMKALYAQINPHFLYNTLDSVVWLAESGDQKGVVKMVMALAKYFRLSLSGARDFITVEEELLQVENYLIIQKLRFGGSFTYRIGCSPDVRGVVTPKILLQPIVENAIIHGVGTMSEGGLIEIGAYSQGGDLLLEVRDNGCGIKPEVLEHILETDSKSSSGIGLKNVHQRIRLVCGSGYGLTLESEMDEGTRVVIRLPLAMEQPKKGGGI